MAIGFGNNPQFSGNCFDDNRYGGTTELTPPGSPLIWYDAANIDGTNNSSLVDMDPVTTWVNLGSRSSANATQATSSAKPTYRNSGGVKWVDFDGGDFIKTGTITTIPQPYTEVIVVGWDATGSSERATDGIDLAARGGMYKGGTNRLESYAGVTLTSTNSIAATKYYSCKVYFNGASSSAVLNDTATAGNAGTNARTGVVMGANVLDSPQLNGRLREILIYDSDMTTDQDLLDYLEAKYGTFPVDF